MIRPNAFLLFLLLPLGACADDPAGGRSDALDAPDSTDSRDGSDTSADSSEPDTSVPDDSDTTEPNDTAEPNDTTEPGDTTPSDTTLSDTSDTSEPGPALVAERYGARLWGPIIQMSQTGRLLWLGTRGNPDPITGVMRAGLYRIDLDSGVVRHYEDELPLEDYSELDPFLPTGTFGPTPTAGVQRYEFTRYLAVARTGLLLIDGSSVTPFPVVYEGSPVVPVQLAISEGSELAMPVAWMSSDRGLLRLDASTFAVEAAFTGLELQISDDTGGDFGKLATDPYTGAVYAAYYATTGASYVVRVTPAGEITRLTPGEGGVPAGRVGEIVWSDKQQTAYVALGAWNPAEGGVVAWNGTSARVILREGALATAHSGESAAFGAQILALDDARGWLAVGGHVQSGFTGQRGGGLVVIDVDADPARAVGLRTKTTPLYHWHTNHLSWDGDAGRLYVAISDLCSEVKLRNRGLFALRFDAAGAVHYERPILSGVRAVSFDARSDTPWLGLRDDNGGLACDGYPIQTGLGQPQAGGSMALVPIVTSSSDGGGGISLDPGVTAIDAVGGLAIGTYRDGFFLGREVDGRADGFAANQAILGPSLFTEDVLREPGNGDGSDGIWIAGRTSHSAGDPPQLADRGPRGAALITVRDGAIDKVLHYVRASEDVEDIVGLPSGDVRDLLREPDGSVIAACAAERVDLPYDRMEPAIFEVDGVPRMGGLARLAGSEVEVIADAKLLPDPRAVTRDGAGRLLVADAERGVMRQDGENWAGLTLPGLPADAVPQALWAGAGDDLALASSRGLWVRIAQRVLILDDVGFAWAVEWHGDRLYVGTDVGLVVVRASTAAATVFPAPPAGFTPPFPSE